MGEIVGHALAILFVIGPVLWAIRRADKLSEARTNALAFRIDNFLAGLDAARSEKAMRLSALPGVMRQIPAGSATPPIPPSGVRLAQPEIDDDQRETFYGRKP